MAIYSAIACTEEHPSPSESWDVGKWDTQVTLRTTWALRHTLIADILGNQRVWPHSGFAVRPRAHSAAIVPEGGQYSQDGQASAYEYALVTIGYSSDVTGTNLVSESLEPTVEFLTLDHKKFRWGAANGDPLQEAEAPGKLLHSMTIVRTLFQLASIPAAVRASIGGVNDVVYNSTLLGLSFPAETLLFGPPSMSRTITTAGSEGWNLTLNFMDKPEGWNKFWRAKTELYSRIFNVGGGQYDNYPLVDFSTLLA